MPRYFFHTLDGFLDLDQEGTELADDNAARLQAVRYIGELLQSDPNYIWDGHALRVNVTNETGKAVFTVLTMAVGNASKSSLSDRLERK